MITKLPGKLTDSGYLRGGFALMAVMVLIVLIVQVTFLLPKPAT